MIMSILSISRILTFRHNTILVSSVRKYDAYYHNNIKSDIFISNFYCEMLHIEYI